MLVNERLNFLKIKKFGGYDFHEHELSIIKNINFL